MMRVAGVYGEEVIVSSEAPERRGAERSREERSVVERSGVERRGEDNT